MLRTAFSVVSENAHFPPARPSALTFPRLALPTTASLERKNPWDPYRIRSCRRFHHKPLPCPSGALSIGPPSSFTTREDVCFSPYSVGKVHRNDPLHLTLPLAPITDTDQSQSPQQGATHHHRKRLRRPWFSVLAAARALRTSRRSLRHRSAGWNGKREGSAQMTQRRRTGSRSLEWRHTWHSSSATGFAAMPPGE
ncbi:hypothetical protein PHSY_002239 [Pseudozyma hubeiensis SY62]|uniref:Uncharacterized protein n=1 Tax=Pseudozyma hubeiensis (strain SY62) TaxID=1305764 RepID=R9P0J4_PSEHS|nr:hypothetical protein PHSY_002239 [Pseudozyma hubeiensis SY62]GAC94666.1 hypothetical protein PHSY_002239 [Pseudozyma hubeiensis SY62]